MSKTIKIRIERTVGGFWSYIQRSPGELPCTPLFHILKWLLEQLNFGHYKAERDSSGDVVSLTIGKRSPVNADSADEVAQLNEQRLMAVNVAGIFAQAREGGIEPRHKDLSKQVSSQRTDWSERNTEFYHAFDLLKVLARINKKTFYLEAPPVKDSAPTSVLSYLQESTRCWLYGFYGASVALSRACLEDSLRKVISPPVDSLESLINAAGRTGRLDGCMIQVAHSIRKTGNKFLHGHKVSEVDSRDAVDGMRSVIEHLFSD